MKNTLFYSLLGVLCVANYANAYSCRWQEPDDTGICEEIETSDLPSETEYRYLVNIYTGDCLTVPNAVSCYGGATLKSITVDLAAEGWGDICDNVITQSQCVCECDNCESDGNWTRVSAGYERRISRYCTCDRTATCSQSYSYRCAAGYWGNTTNGTTGCTKCTGSWTGANNVTVYPTSNPGSIAITGCYFPMGDYKDAYGNFTLTQPCDWRE